MEVLISLGAVSIQANLGVCCLASDSCRSLFKRKGQENRTELCCVENISNRESELSIFQSKKDIDEDLS